MEEFRELPGFENYRISNLGRIYSTRKRACLKVKKLGNSGYYQVRLYKDGQYHYKNLHRLIAEVFIPNPLNLRTVNHINGNKLDNRVDNLEWADDCKQQYHACLLGLKKVTKHILTEDEILDVYRRYFENHESMGSLARFYRTRKQQIAKLVKGQRHKSLYRQYRGKSNL